MFVLPKGINIKDFHKKRIENNKKIGKIEWKDRNITTKEQWLKEIETLDISENFRECLIYEVKEFTDEEMKKEGYFDEECIENEPVEFETFLELREGLNKFVGNECFSPEDSINMITEDGEVYCEKIVHLNIL